MRYAVRACILRENHYDYVEQLIKACKEASIDEVMMCEDNIFITAIAQPLSAHKEMAEIMKAAVARFRENGIGCTFYLKSLVGHFTSRTYCLPYEKFVGMNGEVSANECCLLDEGFADYGAQLMGYYAACGFERMMLDDDFRSVNHCNGQVGCFCDTHLRLTQKAYGKPLTRQQLMDAYKQFDEESLAIKAAHRKVNFQGQLDFVRKVEQAVHRVDPDVQLGLMASGVLADQFQGRDMYRLLKTLSGEKHRPFLRPPGGYYYETLGDVILRGGSSGHQYRASLRDRVDYVSEVEVYSPRNIFTKTVTMLDLQMQIHALTGFDYLSLNLLDHFGTPPQEAKEYLTLLRDRKAHYEALTKTVAGKRLWGIGCPVPENYVESLRSLRFGLQSGVQENNIYSLYLQKLGLPVCYEETEVNLLTRELTDCYGDEKLKDSLSRGAILEQEAVKALLARGFGEYIGVTAAEPVKRTCYECLTQDSFNGAYAGDRYPVYTANVHSDETCYSLTLREGARALTHLTDGKLVPFGVGTSYFENALGGKVLCVGTTFNGPNLLLKCRCHQLHSAVSRMFGDKLPYRITGGVYVMPLWYKGAGEDVLFLLNSAIDTQHITLKAYGKEQEMTLMGMTITRGF